MTPEQRIISDWLGNRPVIVPNWDKRLPDLYNEFNAEWFNNSLPPLSAEFVCEFCEMPRESAGIFIDAARAKTISTADITVRPGIRINSGLQLLSSHVKIVLLHEMVHAAGITGHADAFATEIERLFVSDAYTGLL